MVAAVVVAVGLAAAIWWSSFRARPIVPINIPRGGGPEALKADQFFLQNGVTSVSQETYPPKETCTPTLPSGSSPTMDAHARTVTYGP